MVFATKGVGPSPGRKERHSADGLTPGLETEKISHDPLSRMNGTVLSERPEDEGGGVPFFGGTLDTHARACGEGSGVRAAGRAQRMEAIGTLASGIAHDFNNILTPILLRSEMAIAQIQPDSPVRNQLEQILTCGQRARDLVQQILNFSHQEEGKPRPLQIALVVREMLKLLRSSLPSTIEIQQDLRGSGMILADLGLIHRLVKELCAPSYLPAVGISGLLEISLNDTERETKEAGLLPFLRGGDYVMLTVKQRWRGISFVRRSSGQDAHMALIQSIVEQHGGKVVVTKDPGGSVTFEVFFPRMKSSVSTTGPRKSSIPRGSENVLLVDDEKEILETLEQMLTYLGYTVVSTTSTAEALKIFVSNPNRFDVVITDLTMPGMTGTLLAAKVHRIRPELPVLLCSGFGEMIDGEKLREIGIRSLLVKPLTVSQIACKIREAFEGKV
jgi:two-component system, cell cycle sensor histidine kinase and response regulator CckA